jgi:XTP/dITP diphosphohydrolase
MKIIFASKNKGKIKEAAEILGEGFEISSLHDIKGIDDIEETGTTFEENAFIKAKTIYDLTGIPAVGDDSGLEVEQLNGAPGIYSARYSGENANDLSNNKKLLAELEKFPAPHHAQFVCTAVFYDGNNKITAKGFVKGQIIHQPRGSNGFGYDPLFLPDGYDRTTAEMTLEEKNRISHRAKAFSKLKRILLNNKGKK